MPLRKTKEQRAAHRAERERQAQEHSARLAAVSAQAARPPLYCRRCAAKLKPDATTCHHCGSTGLAPDQPSLSGFSTVAMDGRCPHCQGTSFTVPGLAAPMATEAFLASDTAAAVIGAAVGAASSNYVISCATCGTGAAGANRKMPFELTHYPLTTVLPRQRLRAMPSPGQVGRPWLTTRDPCGGAH
jgi:ribosomal protein L40E